MATVRCLTLMLAAFTGFNDMGGSEDTGVGGDIFLSIHKNTYRPSDYPKIHIMTV